MKLTRKKIIMVIIQLLLIIFIDFLFDFNKISSYGLLIIMYSIFSLICLSIIQKNIVSPINILYIVFILFQAGIPIVYCLNKDYYNFYMTLFTNQTIIKAVRFTLWSIQAFSITLILCVDVNNIKQKKIIFSNIKVVNNIKYVYKIAMGIFILSTLIVLPLYFGVAYISISMGFSQITRSIVASNALFNLARAFYIPSFFLLVCYGEQKTFTKLAKAIFYITCILALLSGNRTEGILWLITFFYFNRKSLKNKRFNQIGLIIGMLVMVYIAVYIGQNRIGSNTSNNLSVMMNAMGEMGFNFTSICFVMDYVPSMTGFKLGFTYLNSILCMVPKSLDVLHLFDALNNLLPIQWLYDMNHVRYNGLLDFGVGFSTVAESYMNFANLGIIISSLYAIIICKIFNGKWNIDNKWEKYIQMTVFLAFLTFPRRAFNELINNLEYSILFILLILLFFYRVYNRGRINDDKV